MDLQLELLRIVSSFPCTAFCIVSACACFFYAVTGLELRFQFNFDSNLLSLVVLDVMYVAFSCGFIYVLPLASYFACGFALAFKLLLTDAHCSSCWLGEGHSLVQRYALAFSASNLAACWKWLLARYDFVQLVALLAQMLFEVDCGLAQIHLSFFFNCIVL